MEVDCAPDGVTVTLDANELEGFDLSHVHFGDNPDDANCVADVVGDTLTLHSALDQCDPAVEVVSCLVFRP